MINKKLNQKMNERIINFKFHKSRNYPKDKISYNECYELAEFMHDIYEMASEQIGWKTNKNCRVEFQELPSKNARVMIIVANAVINIFYKKEEKMTTPEDIYCNKCEKFHRIRGILNAGGLYYKVRNDLEQIKGECILKTLK